MDYQIFPKVRSITYLDDSTWHYSEVAPAVCSQRVRAAGLDLLLPEFAGTEVVDLPGYTLFLGNTSANGRSSGAQGYYLKIDETGVVLSASDAAGFTYGADTLRQIMEQSERGILRGLEIDDEPVLKQRGIMLDLSRGKVYTLDYLKELAKGLAKNRYNVLQLYTEHTFEFLSHPDISRNTDPLTKADILELKAACRSLGIELQGNLQSLGHMRRILTRPAYRHLAESPLFWSLNTADEESYELLDDLYGELLPLFDSEWVNVCCDEPYDLGLGKSGAAGLAKGELYFRHLGRVHDLAARYGKKIMVFGDVIRYYPELARQLPDDIIFLDWIYDPKPVYDTPALFHSAGRPFWVSPGTGNWNTLFPRLEGSITNIVNLTLEGIEQGATGMLLTDWNDHGGYTQPAPAWFLYAYGAAVAWSGKDPGKAGVSRGIDGILDLPGYSQIILELGEIHRIPPIWSKNRSQDVMALFDEPITGASVRGPQVPTDLVAFDLSLPPGVEAVFERHSHHPMRPIFHISESARSKIKAIIDRVKPEIAGLKEGLVKDQLLYICQAYELMLGKLKLSQQLISAMEARSVGPMDWLTYEDELNEMIRGYVGLQIEFTRLWLAIGKPSEMHLALTYFSQIISRLDYLRDWLSIQREHMVAGDPVDWQFATYIDGGYQTLPTY